MGIFSRRLSRRELICSSGAAAAGGTALVATTALAQGTGHEGHGAAPTPAVAGATDAMAHGAHGDMITVGDVDNARNGFDPTALLTDWDTGDGVARCRSASACGPSRCAAEDKEIEIAPGVMFPAWTYNGRVPGPSLRVTEGDRAAHRLQEFRLASALDAFSRHPFGAHGRRAGRRAWSIPASEFVYEFDAKPFGCHLYHCHALPLKRHMHKGMYGAFVIDPDPARHPEHADVARSRLLGTPENAEWQELVMVMNGFDTNFDGENEFYAVNTVAHCLRQDADPDRARTGRCASISSTSIEFDPINSFHLHANFFDYFDQGTTLTPTLKTVDLIMQCQAQRGILEFTYKDHEPGLYMFHAHQSEFTELGWMGMFDVVEATA